MAEPRVEYAKTKDGVSIACAALGRGPAIVMATNPFGDLNSYVQGVSAWLDQLVAAGRRVIFYDGRGSGSSDRHVVDISVEARVADLEGVVDRMGVESFSLVGRVHGGPPATAYAVRHPDRVTHLVLVDSYIRGAAYYAATPYTRAMRALSGMAEEDWEFYTLALANFSVGFRDTPRAQALATSLKNGMSPRFYLTWLEVAESVDISAFLPEVSVPTLVVHDRTGVLVDPTAARSLASAIRGAQSLSVRGLEEVASVILDFTAAKIEQAAGRDASPQGGLRTVLFTDMVGHTEMMQRLGDAKGRDVLREHERITRDLLRQHGGAEVKTMGDGFLASFGSVTSAVECAIALQRAFAGALTRPSGPPSPSGGEGPGERVSIRIGLNAGEPIEEEGDLFGATVILASRIAAQAGAGEILVPETVRGLLSGKNFLFADRGEFALKGFDDAVRLYEVRWQQ